jgi:hypothetical protein
LRPLNLAKVQGQLESQEAVPQARRCSSQGYA